MKRPTRFSGLTGAGVFALFFLCGSSAWATPPPDQQTTQAPEDSFLASDDYSDSDTIKGVFLKDPEYAKMTEDFTRNDADDFDWGWAAADLNLHAYKTVHVTIKDDYGVFKPEFTKNLQQLFSSVAKRAGLQVVDSKSAADLELGVDIVGYDSKGHSVWMAMVGPSVELEIRIRETKGGKDLYLVRNSEHSGSPLDAAREMAHDMMDQLR